MAGIDTTAADFDYVFAVPDDHTSIIDCVVPGTDPPISSVNKETLKEIRERYPTAIMLTWDEWRAEKVKRQQVKIYWNQITYRRYHDMMEILPPAYYRSRGDGFLVGEPTDHCMATGAPRFAAFLARGGWYLESSRPLTVKEFREI